MLKILELTENEDKLLKFIQNDNVPSYRLAYSDRIAWLTACLSELAYQPFELLNEEENREFLLKKLDGLLNERTRESLNELMHSIYERNHKDISDLADDLDKIAIKIEKTYDYEGTQALLVSINKYLILAFRGTQTNSFKEIKKDFMADANAIVTRCTSKGGVHTGFNKAFTLIAKQIQSDLNEQKYAQKSLIITGHSLGGALATLAAKRLVHTGGIAACYTFGAPRVGDEEWSYEIKTPIYRVVNAADCVTMLPPGGIVISMLRTILGLIPWVGSFLKNLLGRFQGYTHCGDMRYLTNCPAGNYEGVKLTYAVSFYRRIHILFRSKMFMQFLKDHSISIYRKKLAVIAVQRNKLQN